MIWGARDPVVQVADARAVAELIPDARLEVLRAGHVPQLGNPQRVAQLVARFAASCR
jgi:pimeloyl-ACP methyl ester carboxylesterase